MEHFRRLLGTLQQAVDFISSFTTYLLGNEAHPGAEDSGSTKEKRNSSSCHDSEVETTHDGDISPREHLEVFEGPLSTELAPPNQEIQVTSEAAASGVQATLEAVVEASKLPYKWEGQEESQQKLSEFSQLPGGAPKPRPTATAIGSIRQRDLEEPTMTGELQKREPEGTSWTEASQKGEMAATKWPSAGSEDEVDGDGEPKGDQERDQEGTVRNEVVQQGPPDLAWIGGSQHGELEGAAKMVEGQQSEDEKEQEGGAEVVEDQLGEPDRAAAKEGIQPSMPGWAETVEDQEEEGMLGGGERVRRSPEGEPKGELEEAGRIEGSQEREQEEASWNEGAPDQVLSVGEEQKGPEGSAWTEGFQHGGLEAEARMVEAEKEQDEEAEEGHQEEPNTGAVKEDIQEVMLVEDQEEEEEMLGGEEEVGRSPEWEPKGEVEEAAAGGAEGDQELEETLRHEGTPEQEQEGGLEEAAWTEGFQHGALLDEAKVVEGQRLEAEKEQEGGAEAEEEPDMTAAKEGIQPSMLGWAETVEDQEEEGMLGGGERVGRSPEGEPKGELEEAGRIEGKGRKLCQEREREETSWNEGAPDQVLSVGEEQKGPEGSAWTEGFQHGGLEAEARMVEAEKEQDEEAEEGHQEEPNTGAVKEDIQEVMLVEDQEEEEEMLGGEEEVGRSPEWEPKGEVEEAAAGGTEGDQELEETLRHEGTPEQEQEGGLEEAAWTEGFQHGALLDEAKVVEGQRLEAEKEQEGGAEAAEDQQGEPDMTAAKEGIQPLMPGWAEPVEDQEEEGMLGGGERVGRSPEWEPKGELEEAAAGGTEGDQEREREEAFWKEEVQQGASDQAQPEAEADEDQQGEPDRAVAKEGILQAVLGGASAEEDQEEVLAGEEQLGGSRQWESKEPATSENRDVEPQGVAENGKGQRGELAGAEEAEGEQQGEPEEPVRNGAEAQEVEQEEETGEESLERDQEEASERPAEASGLDEGVPEEEETTRDESQVLEEAERRLPEESMGYSASVNMGPLPGPRTFPAEVRPLDTSAQKERVLLRRKSSIRRAPSLKRPKPQETNVAETQPRETNVAEETPSQPQAPRRPSLRHAGFGPMHPNMMAELQTRLRKPQ